MIKWKRYIDEQPKEDSIVVCTDPGPSYENYEGLAQCDRLMIVMRRSSEISWCFERLRKTVSYRDDTYQNLWWTYAKDFPFPDQPERLSEKTSKDDAIV